MLSTLTVRDIVLIEQAALEFAPGLNVLTGETGAGKSILLDCLGLAVGGRGRAGVRPGAASGSATAVFDPHPGHAARTFLRGKAMPHEGEIVLRRSLASDGKSRAFVNDEGVGVGLLRGLGALLLEVHGQADDRGLFDAGTHRQLLDAFAGIEEQARDVAGLHGEWTTAREMLAVLKAAAEKVERNADHVRAAVRELSSFDARPGEEEKLTGERTLLMDKARIGEEWSGAVDGLAGERGAESSLAAALKRFSRLPPEARKRGAAVEAALEQALTIALEARRDLESLLSGLDADGTLLERKEERLFALRALARKYATTPDGLHELLAAFLLQEEALKTGISSLKEAEARVAEARDAYLACARRLSKARLEAVGKLEARVAAELGPLKLGHARFRVGIAPLAEAGAHGLERITFEVATLEGAAFGALSDIASGGELARFSLALKVALAECAPPAVLVFDEVDRGVGGAVADAVGVRLQKLAETTQVLLVTHSPQVAARASRHFRIARVGDRMRVLPLDEDARREEIARMLSGASVTDEARAAARRLMTEAMRKAGPRKKPAKRVESA
ncbi:MAG: DNA repair protein RecN [Rhizomicrobium sp.]